MDLISVIVPICKAEKFLSQCVESILRQTFHNFELILVDDGSPDNCPVLCDRFALADKRVKVIHQSNSGVSAARNAGLKAAAGKYIVMVDSDDYVASDMLEKLYHVVEKNDADIVICDFDTGVIRDYAFPENPDRREYQISNRDMMERSYENTHNALRYIAPWCKIYRKTLFDGLEYPVGKIFEDIYITHQLCWKAKKIVVINNVLSYYYMHDDSIMHKKFHLGKLDYLEALKLRIEFFRERDESDLVSHAYDEYLHSLIWEYSRARDILGHAGAVADIRKRFRAVYKFGHANGRYPQENRIFLLTFYLNPEFVVFYWKVKAKLKVAVSKLI